MSPSLISVRAEITALACEPSNQSAMASLSARWEGLNDFIALQGSTGASLTNVFSSLNFPKVLQLPMVCRLFNAVSCKLYLVQKKLSGVISRAPLSFEEFQRDIPSNFDDIYCVADVSMSWKAYGFESYHDIPDTSTPLLLSFLEILGMAREKGCTNTEASLVLGIPKLHTVVERLVSMGYVVKRVVSPLYDKLTTCRVKSRTVLLHLKRFAAQYDPTVDDLEIEADDSMRSDVNVYFTKLLDFHQIQQIAATDAAQAIGIGSKKLIKLKESFAGYVKSGLSSVCFFDHEVALIYPGRQPHPRLRSCIGFVQGPPTIKERHEHDVAMNSPVYEQSIARLRWSNGEGMSSTTLRSKLCLYGKRAARIATELNTVHGYPMRKQQVGKTQANQLYDKVKMESQKIQKKPLLPSSQKNQKIVSKTEENKSVQDGSDVVESTNECHIEAPSQTPTPTTIIEISNPGIEDPGSIIIPSVQNTDLRTFRLAMIMKTLEMVSKYIPQNIAKYYEK